MTGGRGGKGRFVAGVSGNPTGRPKEYPEVKAAAREHTKEAIATLVSIMKGTTNPAAARVAAANALLDRGYGKAPQHISGDITHHWETVAEAEFDKWISGLFGGQDDAETTRGRLN